MRKEGYDRDWQQCRTKIKNLKKEYREVKDNQTGRGRKTCKYFLELDSILGHRPASVPAALLDTGSTSSGSTAVEDEGVASSEREDLTVNGKIFILLSQQFALVFCTWLLFNT